MTSPSAQLPALAVSSRIVPRRDWVEVVWDTFVSLRLTIPLLILVALSCVLGTFANPENASLNDIAAQLEVQHGTFMGLLWHSGLYSFFELNDLFHSWWFLLLLVLLALNLTACTADRLPRIYTIALRPNRRLTDKVLLGIRHRARLPFQGDPAQEAARIAAAFKVRGFVPSTEKGEDGAYYLFAERGRFSRFGVYVVHAALLLILAGGIMGRLWGYEGTINVFQDGGTFDFIFLKNGNGTLYKHALPMLVRVDDFRHTVYQGGSDKSFESDLSVLGPGGKVLRKQTISVGHPMSYGGWTLYQASYQAAPDRDVARVALVDKKTGERREFKVNPDKTFGFDPGIQFRVVDYRPEFGQMGPAAHIVRLASAAEGGTSDFWVFQSAPGFDLQNREDRYGVEFLGIQQMYFTGLQVARDPGARMVFSGCFVLFFGLFVAFYTSHRRLWAKVTGGEVIVAGTAHKNHFAFEKIFASVEAAVRGEKSAEATSE